MAFTDFPEQQQVVSLLQRSLERGRLGHAYLFTGDQLDSLEDMARTLAKVLNCQSPPRRGAEGQPLDCCDACLTCRKINEGTHADMRWVRPESKSRVITIDQTRDFMQTIHLKPTEAPWKLAIIVAADRMNVQAANAFLKTLEEPPARSILVLLSAEPSRLLETILSRCLRLNFSSSGLQRFDALQTEWITAFCEMAAADQKGLLGRYRLLGTLLERLAGLKADIEKTLSARSPLERYDDIDPKLRDRWEDELAAAIEAEYRRRRSELLVSLQWWLRDVWLQTVTAGDDLLSFPQLANGIRTVAGRLTPREAAENLTIVEKTQRLLGTNVQEALALEVGLLKLKL